MPSDVLLTREQIRRVDRIAAEEYGISGLVLMENAGKNAAQVILEYVASTSYKRVQRVAIFCGTGNNGGDGFVVARHLANADMDVLIGLAGDPERLTPDAAANHAICRAMDLPIVAAEELEIGDNDVVVDGLLGTGFVGDVREPTASLIKRINESTCEGVVALDVPSGLDCNTGVPSNATIQADITVTFVATKVGFSADSASPFVGSTRVVDIGAPSMIVESVLATS